MLEVLGDTETRIRAAERDKLTLVARWCVLHPAKTTTGQPAAPATWSDSGDRDVLDCDETLGGDGAPLVAAFAAEELAAVLKVSPRTAMQLVADVLNLEHRHPSVWARVQSLEVPGWRARRLAQRTASLGYESARWVDEQLVDRIDSCGPVTIDRAVGEARARFEPEELAAAGDADTYEQRKAKALGVIADRLTGTTSDGTGTGGGGRGGKPRFYLHLDASMLEEPTGIGAAEQLGPLTMDRIRSWLGGGTVVVRPVLDLNRTDAVDQHDAPVWMDDLVRLRDRHCVFPWCEIDSATATSTTSSPTTPAPPRAPDRRARQALRTSPPVPATSPLQDLRPLALHPQPRRHPHLDLTPRPHLLGHPVRHHRYWARVL